MDLKERLEQRGQADIFRFWEELDESERSSLLEQASEIDLDELDTLVETLLKSDGAHSKINYDELLPYPYTPLPSDEATQAEWNEAKTLGEEALRAGKVAAFTVAGGQGTRLGYYGPKGTFPITPIRKKPLFQVFAEKLLFARRRYGCSLPWYVMTSHINHEATVSFFQENAYFGLGEDSVTFFKQGRMPAVDTDGKIILESPSKIAMSPDGHGGALRALDRSGSLDEIASRGIEYLSFFQVDNPLVQVIDPTFIGFHVKSGSTMSSKMLSKAYEKEKVGHFCVQDNHMVVVEYSDMPDELTALRDADGQFTFRAGSIAIHIISVSFVRELTAKGSSLQLPFHKAYKKIPYADELGNTIKPNEPNGVKFEMFIFDALPFATKPVVIETTRLGDFSPVKNAEGIDSPESCSKDQQKLFAQWLNAAGVDEPTDDEGVPLRRIEVSPLFANDEASFTAAWEASGRTAPSEGDFMIEA